MSHFVRGYQGSWPSGRELLIRASRGTGGFDTGVGAVVVDGFEAFHFHTEPAYELVGLELVRGVANDVLDKGRSGEGFFGHEFLVFALEQGVDLSLIHI